MEESYLWKSGIAQYEMRLIIEGALVLYENEASSLLSLAMKHQDYEAADAFEALGCALNALQTQVLDLQKAHRQETLREVNERL